tara:strand:+ start:10085 stop:10519 length:435 start_codon:yes stop_codon:yes gene_type:complete
MVDPVTLLTAATTGYSLLKRGFETGREISQMSSEMNSVLDYIKGVETAKKSNKKNDPLNDYLEWDRAKKMKQDLETLIKFHKGTKGLAKYKEFVRHAETAQRQGRYKEIQKRNQIQKIFSVIIGLSVFVGGAIGLIYFAQKFSE